MSIYGLIAGSGITITNPFSLTPTIASASGGVATVTLSHSAAQSGFINVTGSITSGSILAGSVTTTGTISSTSGITTAGTITTGGSITSASTIASTVAASTADAFTFENYTSGTTGIFTTSTSIAGVAANAFAIAHNGGINLLGLDNSGNLGVAGAVYASSGFISETTGVLLSYSGATAGSGFYLDSSNLAAIRAGGALYLQGPNGSGNLNINQVGNIASSGTLSGVILAASNGSSGYSLQLATTGTSYNNKYFRVDAGGNFGIINSAFTVQMFTLSDAGALGIASTMTASGYENNGSSGFLFNAAPYNYAMSAPSGTLHIGRSDLSIAGVMGATMDWYNGIGTVHALDGSGNMGIAGTYYAASNSSLKTNIRDIEFNSLDAIKATSVKHFQKQSVTDEDGNVIPSKDYLGIIADQSPKEISPDGLSHDFARIDAVLLDAVKQLTLRIETLEASHHA